jgi:hypothetical protein
MVADKIRKDLDAKIYCSTAFLNISQSFAKVWHKGLLIKIRDTQETSGANLNVFK